MRSEGRDEDEVQEEEGEKEEGEGEKRNESNWKKRMGVCDERTSRGGKKEGERGCRRSRMEKQREVDGGGLGGGGAEGEQV